MHDDSSEGRDGARIADPFQNAPPPGRWVLWHGPLAAAALDMARDRGSPAPPPPELPPLPAGFPEPAGDSLGSFLLEQAGRRFFLRGETHDRYVSCYLCRIA